MIGATLGHYTILEEIGAGGMGRVYRAHDERLERDVAIKLLPAGMLAGAEVRKRFRKEALALSKLNHPNIATVHDFDTQDGNDFLVMECIAGRTLEEKIGHTPLPEKEVLRLGLQLAEGLAAAHERGVLHRDLKPSNLRVTDQGRLKILDFGLAKLIQQADPSASTESDAHMSGAGTLPYMAPEQILREKLDHRTDLYAAGNVIYEMATGRRPFVEAQASRLMDEILHQSPVSPRAINPKISPALENIALKCLEKATENRYQSATELAVDLRRIMSVSASSAIAARPVGMRWRRWLGPAIAGLAGVLALSFWMAHSMVWNLRISGTSPAHIRSLAVLPLENLSGDPAQDYFADGMTDELINRMAKQGDVRVISRTSIMQYKGSHKPLGEIARALNVDAIVEGSVLRAGNRIRISAELIRAATDEHMWAESYNREIQNVLELQDEVAENIARRVHGEIATKPPVEAGRTVDPQLYESYLQGRYYWNRRTTEATRKALDYFRAATVRDSAYAPAYAGIADCYVTLWLTLGAMPRDEALPLARAAVTRALEIDSGLAEAHTTLGEIELNADWNWPRAESEFKRAIELNPGYATAHHWYGLYLAYQGRNNQAVRELELARQMDPLSAIIQLNLGWAHYVAGDLDYFIQACLKTLQNDPNFWDAHWDLGVAYVQKGRIKEGIKELESAVQLSNRSTATIASLAYAEAHAGRRADAEKLLGEMKRRTRHEAVAPEDIALVYIGLDDKNDAIRWLQIALETHSKGLLLLKVDPWLNSLSTDPRYQNLLRKVGLAGS